MVHKGILTALLGSAACLPNIGNTQKCEIVEWSSCPPFECCEPPCRQWEINEFLGYRFTTNKKTREMFPKGWVEFQIEGAYNFYDQWSAWANVGYGFKRGRSLHFHDRTRISLVPVHLGAAYSFCLPWNLELRVGGGASYGYLDSKNHSGFVQKHVSRSGWGGIAKGDLRLNLTDRFYGGIFSDYSYLYFHDKGHESISLKRSFDASGVIAGVFGGLKF
jgi:hypothetical protein